MAILKVRDEHGVVHELLAIRGEKGKDAQVDYTGMSNALTGKAEGNPVAIKDASPLKHEVSIKVPPSPNLLPAIEEQTANGVTISKTSDGGYVLNGTVETGDFQLETSFTLEAGTYTLSANNAKALGEMVIILYDSDSTRIELPLTVANAKQTITLSSAREFRYIIAGYGIFSQLKDFAFHPQLTKAVTVTKYGKNLLNLANATFGNTCTYDKETGKVTSNLNNARYCSVTTRELNDVLLKSQGKKFTFSVGKGNEGFGTAVVFYTKDENNEDAVLAAPEALENAITFTVPQTTTIDRLVLRFNRGAVRDDTTTVMSDFQIEVGDTATEYEPYIEPVTRGADGNGVVSGIAADGNGVTLFADEGVTITAEYNRDINKAFAQLQALILGG